LRDACLLSQWYGDDKIGKKYLISINPGETIKYEVIDKLGESAAVGMTIGRLAIPIDIYWAPGPDPDNPTQ